MCSEDIDQLFRVIGEALRNAQFVDTIDGYLYILDAVYTFISGKQRNNPKHHKSGAVV